jgi:hypothetical protein
MDWATFWVIFSETLLVLVIGQGGQITFSKLEAVPRKRC